MALDREHETRIVALGHIAGVHGVKGWVRVISHTQPRDAILNYKSWLLGKQRESIDLLEGARHGKAVVALLDGVKDRDQAESMVGLEIGVHRSQLPAAEDNQYYWTDLIGLEVMVNDGKTLGTIVEMMATGANDVMVVEGDRKRLIPFVTGHTVSEVNIESGRVTVNWDADF